MPLCFVDNTKPKGYWKDINNQRAFFDEFAKEEGFDPLAVENWYAIDKPRILRKKVEILSRCTTLR